MKVLAIGAHCDDVELGAGGTLARHVADGDEVRIITLCPERMAQGEAAARVLGARVTFLSLPDQRFDTIRFLEIVQKLENLILPVAPEIVYTHWHGDLNLDHQITARAVLTACRPLPGAPVREIMAFEVPSSTEWGAQPFVPNHYKYVNQENWNTKMRALHCYGGEIKPDPHARSLTAIRSLAWKRGAEVGIERAEAFHQYRRIT